jgi:hypothetical protein
MEKRFTYFDLRKASVDVTSLIGERFAESRKVPVSELPPDVAEGFDPTRPVLVFPALVRGAFGIVFRQE